MLTATNLMETKTLVPMDEKDILKVMRAERRKRTSDFRSFVRQTKEQTRDLVGFLKDLKRDGLL